MRKYRTWLAYSLAATGCDSGGACAHLFEDPVLRIVQVTGAEIPLGQVGVENIVINGRAIDNLSTLIADPAFQVTIDGDGILCELPCGFGTEEGTYSFVVVANTYSPKEITTSASYANFDGGCPSRNSGSKDISIVLDPSSPSSKR